MNKNSFDIVHKLTSDGPSFYDLNKFSERAGVDLTRWPFSVKILLESLLHNENGKEVDRTHIEQLAQYDPRNVADIDLPFKPIRVLLQDFTGVPCIVDLAALRSTMKQLGGDPTRINPALTVDLIIDHSIQVDFFNSPDAARLNAEMEFQRNKERYKFLRWGQAAFNNLNIVPPASGICHQVNLEYIGKVVQIEKQDGEPIAVFDSLVGTDSHTPMINGLGVLGWGVGGIEAEAAMLGQPIGMQAPSVVGVRLTGMLAPGITATDLVLTITQMLRAHGVVGKFVEFFGKGLSAMSVPDRATISNMAPEYGATVGYFPIDQRTLDYMHDTGRPEQLMTLVREYAVQQGVFRDDSTPEPQFESLLHLDLSTVEPSVAGPKRPQDRVGVHAMKSTWRKLLKAPRASQGFELSDREITDTATVKIGETEHELTHGNVVIAAITSCTNTSNPSVLLAAGLFAKKAAELGLTSKPWVKTSFAPGSMIVTEYLQRTGLMKYLEKIGFYLVGYGCTTCIGNSGPIPEKISNAIQEKNLIAAAVLSGNRNFEGRVNPQTRANFLASPPFVVAYAIAGTLDIDFEKDPIGISSAHRPVYLRDLWPTPQELESYMRKALNRDAFLESYTNLESSNEEWNTIALSGTELYQWDAENSYIHEPPFFIDLKPDVDPIMPIDNAHVLVLAGDSITTDHISPAGAIDPDSPAGRYLIANGIAIEHFNSYGSRRGNDQIMVRGTFANIRFRNQLVQGSEGSATIHHPSNTKMDIFSASELYKKDNIPTIVIAGKDYGMGSSRDWAAKGPYLLGVRAVIAESFERIHRSNLVGMGILPLQFAPQENYASLNLTGSEQFSIMIDDNLKPGQKVTVNVTDRDGKKKQFDTICKINSKIEIDYYRNNGILQYVLRKIHNETA